MRTPPEKLEAMLAEHERSGMTGAQFARVAGVRYSTLMYWRQKRRKEAAQREERHRARAMITRIDSKLESKRDVPQSEKVVVEMVRGIRMFISNRRQAAPAGKFSGQ